MRVLANEAVSADMSERKAGGAHTEKGKPWKGSHKSRDSGSKMSVVLPKKFLGISDILASELCFSVRGSLIFGCAEKVDSLLLLLLLEGRVKSRVAFIYKGRGCYRNLAFVQDVSGEWREIYLVISEMTKRVSDFPEKPFSLVVLKRVKLS